MHCNKNECKKKLCKQETFRKHYRSNASGLAALLAAAAFFDWRTGRFFGCNPEATFDDTNNSSSSSDPDKCVCCLRESMSKPVKGSECMLTTVQHNIFTTATTRSHT
jgi:hypothetical protein